MTSILPDGLFESAIICNTDNFIINNFVIQDSQMPKTPFNEKSRHNIYRLSIPTTVKGIKAYAFDNYYKLESLKYFASANIPKYCFNNCSNLKYVLISGKECDTIGEGAFRKCKKLNCMDMYNIKYIYEGAFEYTTELEHIRLPDTLIDIGSNAFKDSGIKSIKIPDSVEHLGKDIFKNCKKLTEIRLSKYLRGKYITGKYRFDFEYFGLNPSEWQLKLNACNADLCYIKIESEKKKIEYFI